MYIFKCVKILYKYSSTNISKKFVLTLLHVGISLIKKLINNEKYKVL